MKFIKCYFILLLPLMISAATFEEYSNIDDSHGDFYKSFGNRLIRRRSASQEKRDISLSYAATNINNKEGTQVKTITVIKNLNDKNKKLKIDPKLYQNENWAEAFRDNFDSYGIIPDVPDVDDLFDYVNKKHNNEKSNEKEKEKEEKEKEENEEKGKKKDEEEEKEKEKKKEEEEEGHKHKEKKYEDKKDADNSKMGIKKMVAREIEKPVTEISSEISEEVTDNIKEIEKIKGDAELLPNFNSSRLKVRESIINLNYSNPGHTVHHFFENYVQLSEGGKTVGGYNYQKPCIHSQPIGSVAVATSSGKTYNIPSNNNSYINPYLAPAITRRPPLQQSTPAAAINVPTFPINSVVPPLQQQQNNNNPSINNFLTQQNLNGAGNTQQQQQPQSPNNSLQPPFQNNFQNNQQQQPPQGQNDFLSTSQRPYVSPNLRSGLSGVSRGSGSSSNGQPSYRINTFNNGFLKPNIFRSRGLKY